MTTGELPGEASATRPTKVTPMLPTSISRPGPRSPRIPANHRVAARAAPDTSRKAAAEPRPEVDRTIGTNVMTAPKLQLTRTNARYTERRPGIRSAASGLAGASGGGPAGGGGVVTSTTAASPKTNRVPA